MSGGRLTGERLKGRWSLKHDRCIRCKSTKRRHEGLGFCVRCYAKVKYHRNIEVEHARRKLKRLRAPIEKAEADYQREKRWKQRNRERALGSQKAHYERNKHLLNRWPVGATVWYWLHELLWCEATIVERLNKLRVVVELRDGSRYEVGLRSKRNISKTKPIEVQL